VADENLFDKELVVYDNTTVLSFENAEDSSMSIFKDEYHQYDTDVADPADKAEENFDYLNETDLASKDDDDKAAYHEKLAQYLHKKKHHAQLKT